MGHWEWEWPCPRSLTPGALLFGGSVILESRMRGVMFVMCGAALSACSAIPGIASSDSTKVLLVSNPSGADVNLSSGGNCTTPCTLPIPEKAGDYNATFTLTGHAPRTIPVHVSMTREHWYSAETTKIDPKQVMAELQPILPPPQTKQR